MRKVTFTYWACNIMPDPMSWDSHYYYTYHGCFLLLSKFWDTTLILLGLLISIAYIRSRESCYTQSTLLLGTNVLKLRCDEAEQTRGILWPVPRYLLSLKLSVSEVRTFHSFVTYTKNDAQITQCRIFFNRIVHGGSRFLVVNRPLPPIISSSSTFDEFGSWVGR